MCSADDIFDTVSGSLGITGAADTIMILNRKRNSPEAELMITGRDVGEKNYAMRFNDSNCTWTMVGEAETVKQNKAYSEIVELIKLNNGSMNVKEIVSYFVDKGEKESTVRWRLSEMLKRDILYSVERGVYNINNISNITNNSNNTNIPNISNIANNSNIPINQIFQINPLPLTVQKFIGNIGFSVPINIQPEPIHIPEENKFIGFIGNIGNIGENIKNENFQDLSDSTTVYVTEVINQPLSFLSIDSTSAVVEELSDTEQTIEKSCNSCEHLGCDLECINTIPMQFEIYEKNGCVLYLRKLCGECSSYSDGYCEMTDSKVKATEYCKMKPLQ